MKYYVVVVLGESINDKPFCSVCGVYTEIEQAKEKMKQVVNGEEKYLKDKEIGIEKENYGTIVRIYTTDGDYSYTIELQEVG